MTTVTVDRVTAQDRKMNVFTVGKGTYNNASRLQGEEN